MDAYITKKTQQIKATDSRDRDTIYSKMEVKLLLPFLSPRKITSPSIYHKIPKQN